MNTNTNRTGRNRTGFTGVKANHRRYEAQISINGRKRYLGLFTTPIEAYAAYLAATRLRGQLQ